MGYIDLQGFWNYSRNNCATISTHDLEHDILLNRSLNGVKFDSYNRGNLYAIDPSKIDLTGTDFTGSKGAIITLENIDSLPFNCNLTDTKIIVNREEDIIKFNLQEYGDNVFIKQKNAVNGEIINVDLNDYINYTGTIDTQEFQELRDILKFDCVNEEQFRTETNRIIAYLISNEINKGIDFYILYNYFNLFKKIMELVERKQSNIIEQASDSIRNESLSEELINSISDLVIKEFGNPINDYNTRIEKVGSKIKIYSEYGVFTIDLLRAALSQENKEIIPYNGEEISIPISAIEAIKEIFGSVYRYMCEQEKKESVKDNSNLSAFDKLLRSLFNNKIGDFEKCFSEAIETTIYNNLEANNYGCEQDLKPIKK